MKSLTRAVAPFDTTTLGGIHRAVKQTERARGISTFLEPTSNFTKLAEHIATLQRDQERFSVLRDDAWRKRLAELTVDLAEEQDTLLEEAKRRGEAINHDREQAVKREQLMVTLLGDMLEANGADGCGRCC